MSSSWSVLSGRGREGCNCIMALPCVAEPVHPFIHSLIHLFNQPRFFCAAITSPALCYIQKRETNKSQPSPKEHTSNWGDNQATSSIITQFGGVTADREAGTKGSLGQNS